MSLFQKRWAVENWSPDSEHTFLTGSPYWFYSLAAREAAMMNLLAIQNGYLSRYRVVHLVRNP